MTNEEAIEIIKNMSICLARGNGKLQFFTALKTAIKALEKQIPKKPLKQVKTIYLSKATEVLCPACNKSVCTWITLDSHSKKVPYCRYCGQMLDWSEGAKIYDPV